MKSFILFLLPGLGDVVEFLPTLIELFRAFPDAAFDCLVMYHSTEEIMKAFKPRIHRVIYADFMNMSKISAALFALKLRKNEYDVSITSYPANRPEYNILSFLVGAKIRIAHRYKHLRFRNLPFLNNRLVEQSEKEHNVIENLKLLEPLGIKASPPEHLFLPLSKEQIAFADNFLKDKGLGNGELLIGMHTYCSPFKNQSRRCWGKENFVELIERLAKEFPASRLLLFGSKNDEQVNNYIYNHTSHKPLLVSNLSILQVAAIIKRCKIFITNDSGLMHIASAVDTPTIAIFGPTNPLWVHPWGVKHKIVSLGLSCSPCFFYSQHPLTCKRKENDYLCITGITTEMVLQATKDLLCEIGVS